MGVVVARGPGPDEGHPLPAPSAADAARTLQELAAIGGRSRRVAYATFTRSPLAVWGVAWLIGYVALDTAPWVVAVPVGLGLSAAAMLGTWLCRSEQVVNGWERRIRLSWLVLMGSSPLLVATITPAPAHTVALFLGALWGIALLLYAVAAGDVALGVVGAVIVATAPAAHIAVHDHDLLVFGVLAGGAMAALGMTRMRTPG